jgi:hypothetical protein
MFAGSLPLPTKRPSGMCHKYPPIYTSLCLRDVQNLSVSARAWVKEWLEYVEPGFGPLHDILACPKSR